MAVFSAFSLILAILPPNQFFAGRGQPRGGGGGGAGGGGRGGSTNLAAARGLHPRNPHTHVGTAAGFSQGVDEELLLRDFANEEEIMAMSQEAMTVEEKLAGNFSEFPPWQAAPVLVTGGRVPVSGGEGGGGSHQATHLPSHPAT